jgi:monooxygenase
MTDRLGAQVLVVGGGPVGLLLAAELARFGIRTVLLEAADAVSERPRATTLHARAVQTLARRGYLEADAAGVGAVTRPFHFAGIPGLPITVSAAEPEPILKRPQADLERLFEERARAAGVRILRGHRVAEVGQDPAGVRVVAEGPQGPVSVTADYLVGADGTRSLVREQAGIGSETCQATVSAIAAVVTLPAPRALSAGWHRTPYGWLVVTDRPDGTSYLRALDFSAGADDRTVPTAQELRRQVARLAGHEVPMTGIRWLSRFSDFSRLADTFRSGRILLAGDAAHQHFPIGGQGLGAGLLDAVNLGWKLALTVRGRAGSALLDSYDLERRPAARRVIDNTRAQLVLMRPDPALDPLRGLFAELLASGGAEAGYLGNLISAQDTVLPARTEDTSAWEGRFLPNTALVTGHGATDLVGLLRPGRLLLTGERADRYREQAGPWADLLSVVRTAPTDGLPAEAVLVRPDGYVAWAADGGDLSDALAAHVGAPPHG